MEGETGRRSRSRSISSSNSNDYSSYGHNKNNNESYGHRIKRLRIAIPASPSVTSASSAIIGRTCDSSASVASASSAIIGRAWDSLASVASASSAIIGRAWDSSPVVTSASSAIIGRGWESPPVVASASSAIIGRTWDSSAVVAFGDDDDENENNSRRMRSRTPPRSRRRGSEERSYHEEHAQYSFTSPGTPAASPTADRASNQQLEHPVTQYGDQDQTENVARYRSATPISRDPTQTRMAVIRNMELDEEELSSGASIPANRIAIEQIARINISEQHVRKYNICPVCLEPFRVGEEARQMKCGHIFYQKCLFEWLDRNATCPVCRFSMRPPA